jgi:hypothetical protein
VKYFVSLQFLKLYKQLVGLLGQVISPSQGHYLPEQCKQNNCRQTSMPRLGFDPTAPLFEWVKTFRALDRVATDWLYIAMYFLASLLRNHVAVASYVKFHFKTD